MIAAVLVPLLFFEPSETSQTVLELRHVSLEDLCQLFVAALMGVCAALFLWQSEVVSLYIMDQRL